MKVLTLALLLVILIGCGPKQHVYFACKDRGYSKCRVMSGSTSLAQDSTGKVWINKHRGKKIVSRQEAW